MQVETPTRISLLSVLTITEEVRTNNFYFFNCLLNCIIVFTRYYQCISVLTITEELDKSNLKLLLRVIQSKVVTTIVLDKQLYLLL